MKQIRRGRYRLPEMKRWLSKIIIITMMCAFMPVTAGADNASIGKDSSNGLNSQLIQRKLSKEKNTSNPYFQNAELFSNVSKLHHQTIIPSTGDVKILVLPIQAVNASLYPLKDDNETRTQLQEIFFGEYHADDDYSSLSARGNLYKQSYGKLNLQGTVLPVYNAAEIPSYYNTSEKCNKLIQQALESYDDINFSDYDNDKDGYIDCLHVVFPNYVSFWWYDMSLNFGLCSGKDVSFSNGDIKGINSIALSPFTNKSSQKKDIVYTLGCCFGLSKRSSDNGYSDIMYSKSTGTRGSYFNVYDKYLLDWIEPVILSNLDSLREIELSPAEIFTETSENAVKAVIWAPDPFCLPFMEFYMAEYRTGGGGFSDTEQSGILLWHCNSELTSSGYYKNSSNYLQPVTGFFKELNEFSDDTTPSSKFYDDLYTGAYMKVTSLDESKASIFAGFRNPDLSEIPSLTISAPTPEYIRGTDIVKFPIEYKNFENIDMSNVQVEIVTTGTVTKGSCSKTSNKSIIDNNGKGFINWYNFNNGDGTVQIKLSPQGAKNGYKYDHGAISPVIIVDNTPPSGMIIYSTAENGAVTATLTATEEIQPIEMTHTFNNNGTYTFQFKDLAGNEGSATAFVDWIDEPIPTTAPTIAPTIIPTTVPTVIPTALPTTMPTAVPDGFPVKVQNEQKLGNKITLNLMNMSDKQQNGILILAEYSDNKQLVSVQIINAAVNTGSSAPYEFDADENSSIHKILVWNSVSDMLPLAGSVTIK